MAFERTASAKLIESADIFVNLGVNEQYLLGKIINNKAGEQSESEFILMFLCREV